MLIIPTRAPPVPRYRGVFLMHGAAVAELRIRITQYVTQDVTRDRRDAYGTQSDAAGFMKVSRTQVGTP